MEQEKYLVDTNALIDYLGNMLPASGMRFMHLVIDDTPKFLLLQKLNCLDLIRLNLTTNYCLS